jgi:hypothetical protein
MSLVGTETPPERSFFSFDEGDGDGLGDSDGEGEGDSSGLGDGVGAGEDFFFFPFGDGDADGDSDGELLAFGLGVGDSSAAGVGVGVGLLFALFFFGEAEGDALDSGVAFFFGEAIGDGLGVLFFVDELDDFFFFFDGVGVGPKKRLIFVPRFSSAWTNRTVPPRTSARATAATNELREAREINAPVPAEPLCSTESRRRDSPAESSR